MSFSSTEVVLSVNNMTFAYGASNLIFENISCMIRRGEMVCVIGPNGSGKSTFLKLLCGLLSPNEGDIFLENRALASLSPKDIARVTAYVPQRITFSSDFTVREIIAMGRYAHAGLLSLEHASDKQVIENAMKKTEVERFRDRTFDELSGGERQRVIIASALAQEPSILLLDEPSASLDIHYQIHLFNLLQRLNQSDQITIIAAVHDINIARWYFPRCILLDHSPSVADGSSKEILTPTNLQRVFKVKMNVFKDQRGSFDYFAPDYTDSGYQRGQ